MTYSQFSHTMPLSGCIHIQVIWRFIVTIVVGFFTGLALQASMSVLPWWLVAVLSLVCKHALVVSKSISTGFLSKIVENKLSGLVKHNVIRWCIWNKLQLILNYKRNITWYKYKTKTKSVIKCVCYYYISPPHKT